MPEFGYQTDSLRTGSSHADDASAHASRAAAALDEVGGGSPFGDVNGAASLHGAVGTAKQHHQTGAQRISTNMSTAAQRASNTAGLGDANTRDTTRLAPHEAPASAITSGM